MYLQLATIALLIFIYSLLSSRLAASWLSAPILFVAAGLAFSPLGMNLIDAEADTEALHLIIDLALALILFIDAAHANFSILKRYQVLPVRMLIIGLPGVIALGTVVAFYIIPDFNWLDAAIAATVLAATDAALGKPVITNQWVPAKLRESLNVESGLNDGLCVPVLLLLLAIAKGQGQQDVYSFGAILVIQEIGIGVLVGLLGSYLGVHLIKYCYRKQWITLLGLHIGSTAMVIAIFATAQSLHGSGYIAAFVGGLVFGYLFKKETYQLLSSAEASAETLAMLTWFTFGSGVLLFIIPDITWEIILYSLLSLTIIRVLPIVVSLIGAKEPLSHQLFLGWFGPRGLASIVFTIMVLNSQIESANTITAIATCTVIFSLIAHGISANIVINKLWKPNH
ncbi:sodium:proton antiporter [Paraferrimonas sp. SM1919]|uniref:cation:proton antiporter n=1 Tax=Paraferrimonas sp. SM1919 TaxID=2662263 RepID=UPI0013D29046|nr:cation:proton antiporter [Paraferrimonas sp. SM1919]